MKKIWLGVIVVALGVSGSAGAQDSMMQKLMGRPPKANKEPWATDYNPTTPATPATDQFAVVIDPPAASILPAVPVVAPAVSASNQVGALERFDPTVGTFLPAAPFVVPPAPVTTPTRTAIRQTAAVEPAAPVVSAKIFPAAPPPATPPPATPPPAATPIPPATTPVPPAAPPVVHEAAPSRGARVAGAAKEKCDKVQFVLGRLRSWVAFRQLHGCCCDCASCCHIPQLYLYTVHDCVEGQHAHELPCCAHESGPFRGVLVHDPNALAASRKKPVEHP